MHGPKSIEYGGLGQSGYTAGRHQHDRALERELQAEYAVYLRGDDGERIRDELGTDDRWTGRGGPIAHDHAAKDDQTVP